MSKTVVKSSITSTLLFWALLICGLPLHAAPLLLIKEIDIIPVAGGDALHITYEGEIDTLIFSVGKEKQATLSLTKTENNQKRVIKKRSGKLINGLKWDNSTASQTKLNISFKRRLGRHIRKQLTRDGKKLIYLELLDEVLDRPPEPTEKSVIQPVIEKNIFVVNGTKEQKSLDYKKDDRKQLNTDEFLSLFGHKVTPRPNRVTALNYELGDELLKLKFTLHHSPSFTLNTRSDPPRIELKIKKILGDFEINHATGSHAFLDNISTTRDKQNTLIMQVPLSETAQATSKIIKNSKGPGYQFIVNIQRIYPWETEAAIPDFNIR